MAENRLVNTAVDTENQVNKYLFLTENPRAKIILFYETDLR